MSIFKHSTRQSALILFRTLVSLYLPIWYGILAGYFLATSIGGLPMIILTFTGSILAIFWKDIMDWAREFDDAKLALESVTAEGKPLQDPV